MALTRPEDRVLLNAWTRDFLDGRKKLLYHEVLTRLFPDGTSSQSEPRAVFGDAGTPTREPCGERFAAMYPLYRYRFKDGREYREVLQSVAKDDSGSLVYLLSLQTEDGKTVIESCWGVKEIADTGYVTVPLNTG